MPRICSICGHPNRAEIDTGLIDGEPFRHIAARYGVSTTALQRHKALHLPAHLTGAADAAEQASADALLGRLRALNPEVADVLGEAKASKDHDLRLRAIARAEKQLELEARLLRELDDGMTINVAMHPEVISMRTAVLEALRPYSDARRAVAEALAGLEVG